MRKVRFGETGTMAPLAVVATIILISVLSFGIDQGIAYAAKDRQVQALDAARRACMDPTGALPAKFSEDPGRAIAQLTANTLAEQGVLGDVTVWFYEAPASSMPDDERLWVIGMQVSQDVPTAFGRALGVRSIPASTCLIIEAKPYASVKVWRPQQRICGCYRLKSGSNASAAAFASIGSIDGFPGEMADRIHRALEKD